MYFRSLFPIDLTFHAAIFSVSYIPNGFSFFVPGLLSSVDIQGCASLLMSALFSLGGLPAHLGCELSLDGEPDFDKKINSFQRICGAIRTHLKKTRTDTQMKFYKS